MRKAMQAHMRDSRVLSMTTNFEVFSAGARAWRQENGISDQQGHVASVGSLTAGAEAVAKANREDVETLRAFIREIAPWTDGESWHKYEAYRTPDLLRALGYK